MAVRARVELASRPFQLPCRRRGENKPSTRLRCCTQNCVTCATKTQPGYKDGIAWQPCPMLLPACTQYMLADHCSTAHACEACPAVMASRDARALTCRCSRPTRLMQGRGGMLHLEGVSASLSHHRACIKHHVAAEDENSARCHTS